MTDNDFSYIRTEKKSKIDVLSGLVHIFIDVIHESGLECRVYGCRWENEEDFSFLKNTVDDVVFKLKQEPKQL